jgi:hypothetical protein
LARHPAAVDVLQVESACAVISQVDPELIGVKEDNFLGHSWNKVKVKSGQFYSITLWDHRKLTQDDGITMRETCSKAHSFTSAQQLIATFGITVFCGCR